MHDYQKEFIDFLVESGALQFGTFTLKSGRTSPYFVNTGSFDTGAAIDRLGSFYAAAIVEHFGRVDTVYGPAYKGIPLAVAAAANLAKHHGQSAVGYTFDRKEAKDHGEGGGFVGRSLKNGDRVVMVDDVFTTGGTKLEAVAKISDAARVKIVGLVIAVDRMEQTPDGTNGIAAFTQATGIPVQAIVSVRDLLAYLPGRSVGGRMVLDVPTTARIEEYLTTYGLS